MGRTLEKFIAKVVRAKNRSAKSGGWSILWPGFRYPSLADSNTRWIEVIFHKMKLELLCSNWQI